MKCLERLSAYLRENQVPFQIQHHPTAFTAQEVAAIEHVPGKQVAKVVVILADGRMAILALPASHHVDLARVGVALGAQEVRLAHEEEFAARFPDCEVGAMPPFGNLYDLPVYVDAALAEDEDIVFQAGTHRDTMSLRYADFQRLAHPIIAEFARHN